MRVKVFMSAKGPGDRKGALTLRIATSRRERTRGHQKAESRQENGSTALPNASPLLFLYHVPRNPLSVSVTCTSHNCVKGRITRFHERLKSSVNRYPIINAFLRSKCRY